MIKKFSESKEELIQDKCDNENKVEKIGNMQKKGKSN